MTSPELVAAIQRDRERETERNRFARLVARIDACCSPSFVRQFVDALRGQRVVC